MARHEHGRPGFTLVELLVVIAIIAVLMTLAVAGIFRVSEGQRQANTEITMRTVTKTLERHWNDVIRQAKSESPSAAASALAGGDLDRARVIWIKLRLMEAFPVSFAEIDSPWIYDSGLIPVSSNRRYLASYQQMLAGRTGTTSPATESSACLLMALSLNRANARLEVDNLTAATLQDTDGDGLKEIVDSWGKSLAFFRFVGVAESTPDPMDPNGTLLNTTAWGNQATYMDVVWPNHVAVGFQPIPSPRGAVLVSAGPDQRFGLDSLDAGAALPNTMTVASPGDHYDNLYSFKLR